MRPAIDRGAAAPAPAAAGRRRKIALTAGLLALLSLPARPAARAACEVFWRRVDGAGLEGHARLDGGWALLRFVESWPSWPEVLPTHRSSTPPPDLQWAPVSGAAPRLRPLGRVGGLEVYEISYSRSAHVLVWNLGDWTFCPVLLLEGDPALLAAIEPARVFRWRGRELLSVRVLYAGMGALQDTLFFAPIDGSLVHLRRDPSGLAEYVAEQGIELWHKGGGFCEGTLVWQKLAWRIHGPATETETELRVAYRIDGETLRVESVDLVPQPIPPTCDLGF